MIMTQEERNVLLVAFALAYRHGIKDMDEAVDFAREFLASEDDFADDYRILVTAYKKFRGVG